MVEPLLVTRRTLLLAGHSSGDIQRGVRHRRLTALAPGCYVATDDFEAATPDERYRLLVRAVARRSPDLIVSDVSAAALLRLPLVGIDRRRVHFVRQAPSGQRRTALRWVRSVSQDTGVIVRDGIRMTSMAQTIVDASRWAGEDTAVVLGDAALHRRLTTPDAILGRLQAAWHGKGIVKARMVLPRLDGRSESPGESLLRLTVEDAGLAGYESQIVITDEQGRFVGRADGGFPEAGVLVEFDGETKYGERAREALIKEKRRQDGFSALGWWTVRAMWPDFEDRAELAARIRRALDRQRGRRVLGTARPLPPVMVTIPELMMPRSLRDALPDRRPHWITDPLRRLA